MRWQRSQSVSAGSAPPLAAWQAVPVHEAWPCGGRSWRSASAMAWQLAHATPSLACVRCGIVEPSSVRGGGGASTTSARHGSIAAWHAAQMVGADDEKSSRWQLEPAQAAWRGMVASPRRSRPWHPAQSVLILLRCCSCEKRAVGRTSAGGVAGAPWWHVVHFSVIENAALPSWQAAQSSTIG
jgi:hypothetical protein